jgi:hypothetical protein
LNPQALIKDPKDQTLLLQASNEDININVPKMIKWEDIKLPDEWDLPNDMPPTPLPPINISETNNLNSVEQYLDGAVKIRFDHSKPRIPPMIKYNKSRHSFSGSSSVSKREREINEHLRQLNLDKQKDIKQKGVKEENTQVNSAYYLVDNQPNKNTESDNESLNRTPSDMDGEIDNQLNVIKKPFEINWNMLNLEFDSEKNKGRREKHHKTYNKKEKKIMFDKWKSVMQDLRMNIYFFDFVDNYYSELKELNVLTTSKWTKPDKSTVESSHPPKANILIKIKKMI